MGDIVKLLGVLTRDSRIMEDTISKKDVVSKEVSMEVFQMEVSELMEDSWIVGVSKFLLLRFFTWASDAWVIVV